MYSKDDRNTAKIGDRVIAAIIAGLCGFFIGGFFGIIAMRLVGENYGLAWFVATGFAAFAFIAPSRSTEIWSAFWEELLGFFSSKR